MANASKPSALQVSVESEPEGDFFRFPKLPASVRGRIWKDSIPRGRVVDIVFDTDQDRYFSFHAIIPAILHTSKEARAVGLRFYILCFGTESHPALIPFDFEVDCLLFDDWLAPRTKAKNVPPPIWASELARVIGPMGGVELQSIHRIALSIEFFTSFSRKQFIEALQLLFKKFPTTNYLVFVVEARHPYVEGPIIFWDVLDRELEPKRCCKDYLARTNARITAAVEHALILSSDEENDMELELNQIQLRFRGVTRGEDDPFLGDFCDCPNYRKYEHEKEEYLEAYWQKHSNENQEDEDQNDENEEDDKNGDTAVAEEENRGEPHEQFEYRLTQGPCHRFEHVPEEFEDEKLEQGELEELLMDGFRDIAWRCNTRSHARYE